MSPFLIIVYLIILAGITGFCLVKADIKAWTRVFLVAVALFVSSAYYFHVDSLRGYSTTDLIEEGKVVGIEIVQPNDIDAGGIYVWMYEEIKNRTVVDKIFGINSEYMSPRYYRLPYTKENQRKFDNLQAKLRNGYIIKSINKNKKSGDGNESGPKGAVIYGFEIIDPRPSLKDQ